MARRTASRDFSPVINAAQEWVSRCLIRDGSILSPGSLWTPRLIEEVRSAFIDHPDAGVGTFRSKLEKQLGDSSADAIRLTAEMLWELYLFPSAASFSAEAKRSQIREFWMLSDEALPPDLPFLSDAVLGGIGSAGPGFNNHRWRELKYLILLAGSVKRAPESERASTLSSYDGFSKWLASVPEQGRRQLGHMLRYFAFPDRVERMASNGERQRVLAGFQVAPVSETRSWSDTRLDDALLTLRNKMQSAHPQAVLDFYESPLKEHWQEDEIGDEIVEEPGPDELPPAPPILPGRTLAVNAILYGPPGTGKTYRLQQMFARYTDTAETVDNETWLLSTLGDYGWRQAIAAALAAIGRQVEVPEIRDHEYIRAKARQRGRSSHVLQTLWSVLQTHTPLGTESVQASSRREPFIFSKTPSGQWHLVPGWNAVDAESAELSGKLQGGRKGSSEPIKRYRTVTFHPSFSYEDFVRGIRPVIDTTDGSASFRIVDGVFKQMCDEARANPGKRYAIFIDEINRANIAKVFGELISLIEVDKRAVYDDNLKLISGMTVQLPGSSGLGHQEPPFGVPSNLDVYGTMNTADHSIALLDVALRRRFTFEETPPDYEHLQRSIDGVHLGNLLKRINDRLEYLLDADHRIGHAYFMRVLSFPALCDTLEEQIIPLLQEYFFDDFSRVAMVLATTGAQPLIVREELKYSALFGGEPAEGTLAERHRYRTTPSQTWNPASLSGIYGGGGSMAGANAE